MAQTYPRKALTVFGNAGGTSNFGQFGSQAASAPLETKDVIAIQALGAWADGWQEAVALGEAPYLQDMNGAMYVHSYMQGSLFEEGIPEYDASTVYSFGSVVKLPYTGSNNFQIFVSLGDANTGNALPTAPASNAHWQFVYGFIAGVFTMGTSIAFGNTATEGIIGTLTNDAAAAGKVGEYIEALFGGIAVTTTDTFQDMATIALTAGDWDVSLNSTWTPGTGLTTAVVGISAGTAGNAFSDRVIGSNDAQWNIASTVAIIFAMSVPTLRISLAAPTTIRFKGRATFGSGSPNISGRLSARRVR